MIDKPGDHDISETVKLNKEFVDKFEQNNDKYYQLFFCNAENFLKKGTDNKI